MDRYGFGKTPLGQALAQLAQEGLVRVLPRRGYMVSPISLKEVQDLFAVRQVLEAEAARLAAGRVNEQELRDLDRRCFESYEPGNPESWSVFLELNREFHSSVALACGNKRLADLVIQLLWECERLFHVGIVLRTQSEQIPHEHHALVDALVEGDSDAAARIATQQILDGRKRVVDRLLSRPELVALNLARLG